MNSNINPKHNQMYIFLESISLFVHTARFKYLGWITPHPLSLQATKPFTPDLEFFGPLYGCCEGYRQQEMKCLLISCGSPGSTWQESLLNVHNSGIRMKCRWPFSRFSPSLLWNAYCCTFCNEIALQI